MSTPLRQIKRQARRDLHNRLQIPAVYLASRTAAAPYSIVHVRLHNKFDRIGDVKGSRTYPAEMENLAPQIVFDLTEFTPQAGAIVSIGAGEAYQIDHALPPDDEWQHVYVTRLFPDRAANLPYPDDTGTLVVVP